MFFHIFSMYALHNSNPFSRQLGLVLFMVFHSTENFNGQDYSDFFNLVFE